MQCGQAERAYLVFDAAQLHSIETPEHLKDKLLASIPAMEEKATELYGFFDRSGGGVYKNLVSGQFYAAIQGYSVDPFKFEEKHGVVPKSTIACYTPIDGSGGP